MWVRFNKKADATPKGAVIWSDDDTEAEKAIKKGLTTRCTGPDGIAFGEAAPEDVEKQLKKEKEAKEKNK